MFCFKLLINKLLIKKCILLFTVCGLMSTIWGSAITLDLRGEHTAVPADTPWSVVN